MQIDQLERRLLQGNSGIILPGIVPEHSDTCTIYTYFRPEDPSGQEEI